MSQVFLVIASHKPKEACATTSCYTHHSNFRLCWSPPFVTGEFFTPEGCYGQPQSIIDSFISLALTASLI